MELDLRNWHRAANVLNAALLPNHPARRRAAEHVTLAVRTRARLRAPIREGILRQSATSRVEHRGPGLMGTIEFGGLAEAYAAVQHEHDEFQHPKGGIAHYLYGAADSGWNAEQERESTAYMENAIRAALEAAL